MAKIYVDTTRLIDFYRTVDDKIAGTTEVAVWNRHHGARVTGAAAPPVYLPAIGTTA